MAKRRKHVLNVNNNRGKSDLLLLGSDVVSPILWLPSRSGGNMIIAESITYFLIVSFSVFCLGVGSVLFIISINVYSDWKQNGKQK